jgi:hypothetical protein
VVTASVELGISRSMVYRLVAKFRMAAARFANRSGVLVLAFLLMIILAPAKFQRIGAVHDLSTERHFQSEPVAHYSVEAIEALAHVSGSKSHVNPGGWPKSKHKSKILPVPLPLDAATPRQSPGSTTPQFPSSGTYSPEGALRIPGSAHSPLGSAAGFFPVRKIALTHKKRTPALLAGHH